METFERFESEVRSYCRAFPAVFARARGAHVWDENDRQYIDFFAGAGALNYGHNPRPMKQRLLAYIEDDGIAHSLDMATEAKARLIETFRATVLEPRGLDYKIMFPGPTGTNAVESALKLARKVTGRQTVIGFTNAFHGMTLGALAVSGNQFKRDGAGVQLDNTVHMPYENYLGGEVDTLAYFERFLEDAGSGVALPAAVIVETVQGEGGLHTASAEWLQGVEALCRRWDILLIVDDIQVGCGRTGPFFSFERAGIHPDIVCLSKSISGYGIPLALTLIKPECDVWEPGEHNGTFRGHNLAFVTATEALSYWRDDSLTRAVEAKARRVRRTLDELVERHPAAQGEVRGRGLIQGVACGVDGLARAICHEAFDRGLLMETSGPNDEVVKILPPLTIGDEALDGGLRIVAESMAAALPGALKTAVVS